MTKPELYAKIQDIIKVHGSNYAGIAQEITELIEAPTDEFKVIYTTLIAMRVLELSGQATTYKYVVKMANKDIETLEKLVLQ